MVPIYLLKKDEGTYSFATRHENNVSGGRGGATHGSFSTRSSSNLQSCCDLRRFRRDDLQNFGFRAHPCTPCSELLIIANSSTCAFSAVTHSPGIHLRSPWVCQGYLATAFLDSLRAAAWNTKCTLSASTQLSSSLISIVQSPPIVNNFLRQETVSMCRTGAVGAISGIRKKWES